MSRFWFYGSVDEIFGNLMEIVVLGLSNFDCGLTILFLISVKLDNYQMYVGKYSCKCYCESINLKKKYQNNYKIILIIGN